jgi:hypothetical protein
MQLLFSLVDQAMRVEKTLIRKTLGKHATNGLLVDMATPAVFNLHKTRIR